MDVAVTAVDDVERVEVDTNGDVPELGVVERIRRDGDVEAAAALRQAPARALVDLHQIVPSIWLPEKPSEMVTNLGLVAVDRGVGLVGDLLD
jgi:hypothetical protein